MKKISLSRPALRWIAAVLALLLIIGGVVGRYISRRGEKTSLVTAKSFYFTSDLLAESGAAYTLNAGTTEFSFELRNYADALRFADDDIQYTVTVTGTAGATITNASGTISHNAANAATVTISGLTDGGTYTVQATGSAGYSQTLSAALSVQTAESAVYKHLDKSNPDYVILTVWTRGSIVGTAEIIYPNGLIPDETDPAMQGWLIGPVTGTDSDSFNSAYASHQYRFFGSGASLTADSFTVRVNNQLAAASTP